MSPLLKTHFIANFLIPLSVQLLLHVETQLYLCKFLKVINYLQVLFFISEPGALKFGMRL